MTSVTCYQYFQRYIFSIFCHIAKILISKVFTDFRGSENSPQHSLKLKNFHNCQENIFPPKKLRPYRIGQHFRSWLGGKIIFGFSGRSTKKGQFGCPHCIVKKWGGGGRGRGEGKVETFPLKNTNIRGAKAKELGAKKIFS